MLTIIEIGVFLFIPYLAMSNSTSVQLCSGRSLSICPKNTQSLLLLSVAYSLKTSGSSFPRKVSSTVTDPQCCFLPRPFRDILVPVRFRPRNHCYSVIEHFFLKDRQKGKIMGKNCAKRIQYKYQLQELDSIFRKILTFITLYSISYDNGGVSDIF